MKAIIQTLLVILCTVAFISCQKELSSELGSTSTGGSGGPGGGGTIVTHTDSIYLEKYTLVYDGPAGVDSNIFTLQYDTFKRAIGGTQVAYNAGILGYSYTLTFFYNGTDTLPFKYTFLGKSFIYNYPDTTVGFTSYDALGRIIYDSSINSYTSGTDYYKEKNVDKKQYGSGIVYFDRARTALIAPPGSHSDAHYLDTGWLDARKNVIRCSSYDHYATPTYPAYIIYTGVFTYDNKPGPFSYVNLYKDQIDLPQEKGSLVPQKNNYLSDHTENYFSGQPPTPPTIYASTYTHTFNALGMATKSVSSDNVREYFSYRAF